MKFDIFFSICQTEVDGYMPNEKIMFHNFFDQLAEADDLGFERAWVAETHLSCEIQKHGPHPVIPHFVGEIGLNTDILQLAHVAFARTNKIHLGSAVRNILCNGGPVAHAEALRTFLSLHAMRPDETRTLNIGFAAGRFDFSNRPYGIRPRSPVEELAWPVVKGKVFLEATEIFLRTLKGERIARTDVPLPILARDDFRSDVEWDEVRALAGSPQARVIELKPFWNFEKLGVIPAEAPLDLLRLTIGSHDPAAQKLANSILPVGVFNLSITPPAVIEQTHARLGKEYHPKGGPWRRDLMPRTAMVFLEDTTAQAKIAAEKAWVTYWKAMEGTLDQRKVEQAVANSLAGSPEDLADAIRTKYDAHDRLMLWFDFNTHDNGKIKKSMREFMLKVAPQLSE